MRLIGYVRVSTEEQAESGLGLEAQRAAIEAEATRLGGSVVHWEEDHLSSRVERPGRDRALELLGAGRRRQYDGLVVARLDRLCRSVHEGAGIISDAVDEGWALVSITPGIDMTTSYGKAMAHMALVFAELERDLISERTTAALAAKKARGEQVGRAPELEPELDAFIAAMLDAPGATFAGAARQLNRDRVPTARGGRWSTSTVWRCAKRHAERRGQAA